MSGPYTCRQIVEVVTQYLDGGLATADRMAFERHVAICPPCRGYLSQIRWVSRVAGGVRADDLPEQLRDDLLSAFVDWKEGRSAT
jgi:anti-sigma factor RsiW